MRATVISHSATTFALITVMPMNRRIQTDSEIILANYYWESDFLSGICREPGAKEISFQLVDEEENFLMEGKLPVREDGIFYGANIRGEASDEVAYPYHLRALDAEGNVIAGEVEGVL